MHGAITHRRSNRNMVRKVVRCIALLSLALLNTPAPAQKAARVTLMTAGDGSAFLPYGQGIAAYLASRGIDIGVMKSAG
ncbi:MAG: hypothetical protein QOF22_301, partial [Bradyrhizobium sp.]|nr:hypothetical protein [Bradyrhizobium sp.]